MLRKAEIRALRSLLVLAAMCVALVGGEVAAQRSGRPLSPTEIIQLLESGVTPARVEELAQKYGIAFESTPEIEAQLREAGASDDLLTALRGMRPRIAEKEENKAARAETAVLVIEATPGGAQVYLNDEPLGRTSSRGRLKLSALSSGEHELRISLDGYLDHEEKLDLPPRETLRLVVKLQPVPPPPPPEPAKKDLPPPDAKPAEPAAGPEESFPVSHDHAKTGVPYCLGWLTVGDQAVLYRAQDNVHVFNFFLPLIKEVRKNDVYMANRGAFRIRLKDGTNYNFSLVRPSGPPGSLEGVRRSKSWQPPDPVLAAIAKVIPAK